jgi:hypothetical protein
MKPIYSVSQGLSRTTRNDKDDPPQGLDRREGKAMNETARQMEGRTPVSPSTQAVFGGPSLGVAELRPPCLVKACAMHVARGR